MYWSRLKLFLVVVALAMVILAVRLGQLQVVGASGYDREARVNLIRRPALLETRRGAIRDRNGLVLAEDTASFDVCVYYPFLAVEDPALIRRIAARSELSLALVSTRFWDEILQKTLSDGRRFDLLVAAAGQDSSLCRRVAASRQWSELLASRDPELRRLLTEQGRLQTDDVGAAIDRLRFSTPAAPRLSEAEASRLMQDLWIDPERFTDLIDDSPELTPTIEKKLSEFWPLLAEKTGIDVAVLDEQRIRTLHIVRALKGAIERRHGRSMQIKEEVAGPRGVAHPMLVDVNELTKAVVAAMQTEYDWLVFEQHAKRIYPYNDCAAHVVGRVGEVDEQHLGTSPDGDGEAAAEDLQRVYRLHDMVGVTGVEGGMERFLRGRRGIEQRDKADQLLQHEPPQPGQDVRLTLDVPLQSEIEVFMSRPPTPPETSGAICGAVVVIDIRTGALLALVSTPRFDPNTFSEKFPKLMEAEGRPLVHRAIGAQLAQGSIFKAVTATAALHEHKITPSTVFVCNKQFFPGVSNKFTCLGTHGPISLHRALVKSCNIYFYYTGLALGPDKLYEWGRRFGFGTRSGLLIPGEKAGNLPRSGDPKSLAIGQGELMVTPLQAARFMALIASDGKMTEVHVIDSPRPANRPLVRINMDLNPGYMATVRDALTGVVNEEGGTGYRTVRSDQVRIAGKSGTAELGDHRTHAWFVGFAPAEDPQIAFSVVFEYGGSGGAVAGPVAKQIAEAALQMGIISTTRTARR
ncbi:MAG: hypothetical protein JXL80_02210 [Planctomycetes bacterium]|nr:hypothetical protein [Planctomycetota bacterium]